ncbi:MAG TPA: MlaD family protein [Bryobacteraceae bacterium]|nr:MlaD family protein [Bryobacteraceae bacterium]
METRNARIGLFVIAGLVLFGLGMFLIGDRHQVFARHREYYSEFVNLAGLTNGAKVRVAGMDAGDVLAIGVPDSPSSRFKIKWRIDSKLAGLVRVDSVAEIGTEGVVGDTFLSIRAGTAHAAQAAPLSTIPGKEPTELSDLLARGQSLLADADNMLLTTGGKLNAALDGVTTTVSNANDVVVGLKQGRGTAGMLLTDNALAGQIRNDLTSTLSGARDLVAGLQAGRGPAGMILRDEALAGQIRDVVKNGQKASADLAHASAQADALVADLNSRQIPQKAADVMDNLNDATRKVRDLMADVSQPDAQGMSAGANIRASLMNANTATGNLADASEALKHNFLLRGFFKKRGYYNLADLSPEKYRADRAFTSASARRVWLSGSQLFQTGPNGQEQLSANGKALIDSLLTENGDRIFDGPVVVEGYWNGEIAADQLRFSHSRAMTVRQYVQTRFQVDSRDLGAVPLKNLPPKGADRGTWDGICIVLLSKS